MATARRRGVWILVGVLPIAALLGLLAPSAPIGVIAWSVVVFAVLWGFGGALCGAIHIEVGPGEQMLVGAVIWIAGSGVLIALGCASRIPILVCAGAGLVLAVVDLSRRRSSATEPWTAERTTRLVLGGLLAGYLVLNLVAMASTRGNPYDDHVAYMAFVKRLLDCGDLVEPFSFRRLSAYGGQTALQALAAARGDVAASDLLDRGIFQIISVLIVLDLAHRRRLGLTVKLIIVGFLLSLWDMNLNSAAIWTGFACFLGGYGFASREDLSPRLSLALACAVFGAACTLRQNYLVPAGITAALLLFNHVRARARHASWRTAWRDERRTVTLAILAAAAVVVPYMVAAWLACGTALYPILPGTGDPATPLRPTGAIWLDELQFFVTVLFNPEPIRIWWLLVPLMLVARERRSSRPWPAFAIGCFLGFAFLIHSFMLSDSYNLWRYGFAYMTALVVIFALETLGQLPFVAPPADEAAPGIAVPAAGIILLLCALGVHFIEARGTISGRVSYANQNLMALRDLGTAKADPRVAYYTELQGSIPEGAVIGVMLDDAWMLDYQRNKIFNLDLPGFAAPGPGLPSFSDPEHWRAYFLARGIRYLLFVEGDYSTYLYRRSGWVWRMYGDDELYRYIAAHMVDTIDTFSALSRSSRVLFHRDGLYAIDLGTGAAREAERGAPEVERLDRFARRISETELGTLAWQLARRANVVFSQDQGPSSIVPLPGQEPEPGLGEAFRWLTGPNQPRPHRWLMDRTHLRVRAAGRVRAHAKVWIKRARLFTVPTVSFIVDGKLVARATPDRDGYAVLDGDAYCNGWCNAYVLLSTTSEWWLSPEMLGAAKLLEFEWNDAP